MAEKKRVTLLPFGTQKESDHSSKAPPKTVRIKVALPESTEDTCPIFNYKDELAAATKKIKDPSGAAIGNNSSKLDDFEDDDDVRRIARQFEEKYGGGFSAKKKKKTRKDDYADIGMGYDESDSFIDNTDGYDEMIPHNVTPVHGGFYINSGALEFKMDDEANSDFSESSESDDENDDGDDDVSNGSKPKLNRKRIIESSDETDRENKTDSNNVETEKQQSKKQKLKNGIGNGVHQSLKRKLLQQNNKLYVKKKRPLTPSKDTLKTLIRKECANLNVSIPNDYKTDDENGGSGGGGKVKQVSNVNDVIESVVKASIGNAKKPQLVVEEVKNVAQVVVNLSSDGESSHDNSTNSAKKVEHVKLPENLSADIVNLITAIKTCAQDPVKDGQNVFTSDMNSLILKLERKCKCLGKPSKLKVYGNLSSHLKIKTEFLMKRAKELVLGQERKQLKNQIGKFQTEINKIMPSLLENHEKESQRILQKNADAEDNKIVRMPKRRFLWNDVSKTCIKDILTNKKRCLLLEGKSKEVLEQEMTTFLKNEIQMLWPEGWMSMNALNKICTPYLAPKQITNNSTETKPISNSQQTTTTATTTTMKNLPQSFNNSNLSITPIVPSSKSTDSKIINCNSSSVNSSGEKSDNSINLSKKSLPTETATKMICDIKKPPPAPVSPKREIEGKLKVKPASELLKPSLNNHHLNKMDQQSIINLLSDDGVLETKPVINHDRFSPIKEKFTKNNEQQQQQENYCQVIDLSDKHDIKPKFENKSSASQHIKVKDTIISPINNPPTTLESSSRSHKHELSITPAFPKLEKSTKSSCAGDEIQKVMEGLKVLQKMSSPKKSIESSSPTSSAVSVIAVNKSFAAKTSSSSSHSSSTPSTMQRYDYNKSEYNSFQDEFQKQVVSALNHIGPNSSSKNYNSVDRYSHKSSSSQKNNSTGDKYFQSSNNNYTQSSNGLKSGASTSQTGIYSILDDMYANFLTQYGYPKEATAPKSEQK